METMFEYYETLSQKMFQREIPQILLLHVNLINADHLDTLAVMMKRRGYQFITLEEALADSTYQTPDNYVGNSGISWLIRWAMDKGIEFAKEPREPEWVGTLLRND